MFYTYTLMKSHNTHFQEELLLFKHIKDIPHYLIFLTDLQGNILSWNEAAEKVTGYTEAEITGKHFSKFYTEKEIKQLVPTNAIEIAINRGFRFSI